MLVVDRELIILLRAAVAFRREELHVRLFGRQAHRVSARGAWGVLPEWFVFQAVVHPCEGEGAEGEGGEEACFLGFPFFIRFGEVVVVVDVVVVCEVWLLGFVEHEDDLGRVRWDVRVEEIAGFVPGGPSGSFQRRVS